MKRSASTSDVANKLRKPESLPIDGGDKTKSGETDGEEILEFEDDFEDEFEEEEIYDAANDDDVELNLEDEEENTNTTTTTLNANQQSNKAPSVYRPGVDQLEPDQVLEPEPGAYTMLHKLDVQWPCLSFDILPDALGDKRKKYPLTSYIVSGTQADVSEKNKICVMKWSNLQKTNRDGFEDEEEVEEGLNKFSINEESDDDEEEDDGEPELEFRMIKHRGGVNRIRCMPQLSTLVASWSDDARVYVHNIHGELEAVEGRNAPSNNGKPVHVFEGHSTEGFAMAWNPHAVGQMVTGDCSGSSYMWQPQQGGTWSQSRILSGSSSSFSSVEDIEFRKIGDSNCANIFALCGGEQGKVGIVDIRNSEKCATEFVAHKGDTNVLSWNPIVGQLLLTGGDDGTFKVWDVRATSRGALANFKWHKNAVTSVDWHPTDEAVLAVSSADDTISIWDMSVEEDTSMPQDSLQGTEYFPPQLLFLHMGQKSIKEIKFHKQIPGVIISTALDGFNIFKTFNI